MRGTVLTLAAASAIAAGLAAGAPAAHATGCNTAPAASQDDVGMSTVQATTDSNTFTFVPCNVTVSTGTAVHWTIDPSGEHTVTADTSAPAAFDFTDAGGTFTFTTPGSYFYYCMFHGTPGAPGGGMHGVVYVLAAGQTPPPPPKFAGVKLVSHSVHVTKSRLAGVRLTCPAGTVGSCAGTLTLTSGTGTAVRLASKSLKIASGKTATVKVRLSRSEFRKLVKHRKLRLGLGLDVHDGNGTASGQGNETVTLKAPPRR